MCKQVDCVECGLKTWAGCGLHIEQALQGVAMENRCPGWETGKCSAQKEELIDCDVITRKIKEKFGDDIHFLDVQDVSGCASKFSIVLSLLEGFNGVKLLQRHRMINGKEGVLAGIMDNIHALEMKTWTKEQYEKQAAK